MNTTIDRNGDRNGDSANPGQHPTLAQQALDAHRGGDAALLENVLAYAFSIRAREHPDHPNTRTLQHHFPDRSVYQYRTDSKGDRPPWDHQTAAQDFQPPGVCDRPCCRTIRHLRDPQTPAPQYDGSKPPHKAPPTDRSLHPTSARRAA